MIRQVILRRPLLIIPRLNYSISVGATRIKSSSSIVFNTPPRSSRTRHNVCVEGKGTIKPLVFQYIILYFGQFFDRRGYPLFRIYERESTRRFDKFASNPFGLTININRLGTSKKTLANPCLNLLDSGLFFQSSSPHYFITSITSSRRS